MQCVICLDSCVDNGVNFCIDTSCAQNIKNKTCTECIVNHIQHTINSAYNGFCPMITCPCEHTDKKKKSLNFKKWSNLPILCDVSAKYSESSEKLLNILCGGCHSNTSLFVDFDKPFNKNKFFISCANKNLNILKELKSNIMAYVTGKTDINVAYDNIKQQLLLLCTDDQVTLKQIFCEMLSTIRNPERRVNLHLRYLNEYPKIYTKCCTSVHCFKCKIYGYHDDATCETYMNVFTNDIIECPSCQITILKSDGCDRVTCLCGESFWWTHALNIYKTKKFLQMYPTNTDYHCAKILCEKIEISEESGAILWYNNNQYSVTVNLKEWFKQKYIQCPSQVAICRPKEVLCNKWIMKGADYWTECNMNEVEHFKKQLTFARNSLFTTLVPELERSSTVRNLINKCESFCWLNIIGDMTLREMIRCGAMEWKRDNYVQYCAEIKEIEKREIINFVKYNCKPITTIIPKIPNKKVRYQYSNEQYSNEQCFNKYYTLDLYSKVLERHLMSEHTQDLYSSFPNATVLLDSIQFQAFQSLKNHAVKILTSEKYTCEDHDELFGDGSNWAKICGAESQNSLKCIYYFFTIKNKLEHIFDIETNPYAINNEYIDELSHVTNNFKWEHVIAAIGWYNNNKKLIRQMECDEMVINYEKKYEENAVCHAAISYTDDYELDIDYYEKIAIKMFVNNNYDKMDQWYCEDIKANHPMVPNVDRDCKCCPRHINYCPKNRKINYTHVNNLFDFDIESYNIDLSMTRKQPTGGWSTRKSTINSISERKHLEFMHTIRMMSRISTPMSTVGYNNVYLTNKTHNGLMLTGLTGRPVCSYQAIGRPVRFSQKRHIPSEIKISPSQDIVWYKISQQNSAQLERPINNLVDDILHLPHFLWFVNLIKYVGNINNIVINKQNIKNAWEYYVANVMTRPMVDEIKLLH